TGDAGQCTWYAEQAWAAFSDPGSPTISGDGADVVPNLARSTGRAVELTPQPGSLVSWQRQMFGAYGHVAYVAAVDRDGGGARNGKAQGGWQEVVPLARAPPPRRRAPSAPGSGGSAHPGARYR